MDNELEPGVQSELGPEPSIQKRTALSFDTFPEFRFLGIRCLSEADDQWTLIPFDEPLPAQTRCHPLRPVAMAFSAPMINDEVKRHVKLEPDLAGARKDYDPWENRGQGSRLTSPHQKGRDYRVWFPEFLKAYRTYRLISPAHSLADEFGRTLEGGYRDALQDGASASEHQAHPPESGPGKADRQRGADLCHQPRAGGPILQAHVRERRGESVAASDRSAQGCGSRFCLATGSAEDPAPSLRRGIGAFDTGTRIRRQLPAAVVRAGHALPSAREARALQHPGVGERSGQRRLVESAVRDDRGKFVANNVSANYFGRDRFVGLRNTEWVYTEDKPARIELVVVGREGVPVAGVPARVTIEREEIKASRVKGAGNAYLTQYVTGHCLRAVCDLAGARPGNV